MKALFYNFVFLIEGYEEPHKSQIKENIIFHGGQVKFKYDEKLTYLVTPYQSSKNYKKAKENNIKICTAHYIAYCCENEKNLPLDSELIFTPLKDAKGIKEILDKHITISMFKGLERENLTYLIRNIGANFSGDFYIGETDYLIMNEPASGDKFVGAKNKSPETLIVTKKWLEDTIIHWKIQDHKKYYPKEISETYKTIIKDMQN